MAADKKEIDIEKTELKEQGGYRSIRIKTVRGDGVRDMDEVTAEFVSNDFEEFKAEVQEFQSFVEYVAQRAREFNPEREEVEE